MVDAFNVPAVRAFEKRSSLLSPGTCCDRLPSFLERYEELARPAVHRYPIFMGQTNISLILGAFNQKLVNLWSVNNNVGIGRPVNYFASHYSGFDFSEFHCW